MSNFMFVSLCKTVGIWLAFVKHNKLTENNVSQLKMQSFKKSNKENLVTQFEVIHPTHTEFGFIKSNMPFDIIHG